MITLPRTLVFEGSHERWFRNVYHIKMYQGSPCLRPINMHANQEPVAMKQPKLSKTYRLPYTDVPLHVSFLTILFTQSQCLIPFFTCFFPSNSHLSASARKLWFSACNSFMASLKLWSHHSIHEKSLVDKRFSWICPDFPMSNCRFLGLKFRGLTAMQKHLRHLWRAVENHWVILCVDCLNSKKSNADSVHKLIFIHTVRYMILNVFGAGWHQKHKLSKSNSKIWRHWREVMRD